MLIKLLRRENSTDKTKKIKVIKRIEVLVALFIIIVSFLTIYNNYIRRSKEGELNKSGDDKNKKENEIVMNKTVEVRNSVCYFAQQWSDGKTLQNVYENSKLKPNLLNILFHETSCTRDGVISLTSRQACAIESAARINPDHEAFVLFASQVGFRNKTRQPIIDALISYRNINFNYLNITQYAGNTPLEDWIKTGELFRSSFVVSHTSDILRYLSLWKFGGTYLDLDTVSLKPLNSLKPNFAGAESDKFVAAGIINLDPVSGHKLADLFLKDLLKNFNGKDWGSNGPGCISRVLQKYCKVSYVGKMISSDYCGDFQVLPIESCYAIGWRDYKKFLLSSYLKETMKKLRNSIIAHVWNKLSFATPLDVDSNAAYVRLARKYCPRVLAASDTF